ncbi:MAG: DUF1016 family protein [Deltaproteobacteria bacterium]|nr:DUF1016 family protein [Deltaproteobacteria bacterium]
MTDKNLTIKDNDYQNLVKDLKSLIDKGLNKAYKAVDNIKVQTYWQIGERIVREELKHKDRAEYGKHLIDNLTVDLNLRRQFLYEVIQFYRVYPIVRALHGQLSWYHYLSLIQIEDAKKRLFYEKKIIANAWSYRELRRQVGNKLYENTAPKDLEATFQTKLPAVRRQEIFKGIYDFDFVPSVETERELESGIVSNIKAFLKELGEDFCFLDQQVPIKMDGQTHSIDLVLYHRGIPCVVLVDLKNDKLDSRDIGQMNKYVSYYRRHRQYEHEKDTIGLIVCRSAGRDEIVYALDGLEEKIFVAVYKVRLPNDETIGRAIRKL